MAFLDMSIKIKKNINKLLVLPLFCARESRLYNTQTEALTIKNLISLLKHFLMRTT